MVAAAHIIATRAAQIPTLYTCQSLEYLFILPLSLPLFLERDLFILTMDPNAFTAPFQLTKSLKRDVYPAIDPKNPTLSAKGKTILVTGATGGLGGVRRSVVDRARWMLTPTNRKWLVPGL